MRQNKFLERKEKRNKIAEEVKEGKEIKRRKRNKKYRKINIGTYKELPYSVLNSRGSIIRSCLISRV